MPTITKKVKAPYNYSPMGKLVAVSNRYKMAEKKLRRAQKTCNRLKAEMKAIVVKL